MSRNLDASSRLPQPSSLSLSLFRWLLVLMLAALLLASLVLLLAPTPTPAMAQTSVPPLTASFENVPARHDGSGSFTFDLRFSEEVKLGYKSLRDHVFTVTGGSVAKAQRMDKPSNIRWQITLNPDSSADVTVFLPITSDCDAQGAICTKDGARPLSNAISLTVQGPVKNSPATGAPTITGTARVGETLTVDTSGISDGDGLTNATFSYQWLGDESDISGATSSAYTLIDADEGKTITVQVSFADDAGNDESLTSTATTAVAAATPEPTPPAEPPAKPSGLTLDTESGSLGVSVDWDDVEGAVDYLVRWRPHGPGQKLNDGVRTTASAARITVADYGKWVVRVEACNDAGCGPQSTRQVVVEPQPNRAPVVDENAEWHAAFLTADWAPRGIYVSKVYEGIFSDPDGDTLTYTVSVPADRNGLVDTVYIQEGIQRVFIRMDGDGDWGAVTPALPDPLSTTVTLTATDPDGLSASVSGDFLTYWVAPTITGGATVLSFAERGTAGSECCQEGRLCHPSERPTPTSAAPAFVATYTATYTATYADNDAIVWSVEGTDAAEFAISAGGALSFTTPPNFDSPGDADGNNTYLATVKATANGNSDSRAVAVTVTDGNDPPSFVQKNVALFVEEGYAHYLYDFGATDSQGDTMIFSLTGEDSEAVTYEHFHIAGEICYAALNLLHYDREPDYEQPIDADKDGVFEVILQVSDGTLTTELPITITVTDVDEAPVIEGLSAVDFAENSTADVGEYTATDPEGDTSTLNLGGTDAASFTFTNGVLKFRSAPDFETKSSYSVTFTASDGTHDATLDVTVTITDVNEAPPLTASFESVPHVYDGWRPFTFELHFSEEVKLSSKTLRDHVFMVRGGTVVKAQRLDKTSNTSWRITVRPDSSNAIIRLVLPVTTDCETQGAICTVNGRKLSNSLDLFVLRRSPYK